MSKKIALVVSHPIQHFCPQYVSFAQNHEVAFKVFFASALGYKKYLDPYFKTEISWGNLHLDKFDHEFLNGEVVIPSNENLDAVSLNQSLHAFEPDLVIIYGYFQKFQRRAHRWAVANKTPLAYISDSELRHRRNWLKEFIKFPFIYRYFSRIKYFLSVGDANEAFYMRYGVQKEKLIRMHFPIDISQYEECYAGRKMLRNKMRAKYQLDEAGMVISVVGKLASWKNQDHIIDAMGLLEKEGVILNLFILGSGEMQEQWETKSRILKSSKVFFTGFVNIEDLPGYYAASDFYVHPAAIEPHSIAVSEAIYMGCPVVISDRCGSYGPEDDVQEGKNGYVYEFGNIRALADKIKMLATDAEVRRRFSEYSHDISKHFQQKAHRAVLEDLARRIQ